jgi:DNA-binding response OmpR family regulator
MNHPATAVSFGATQQMGRAPGEPEMLLTARSEPLVHSLCSLVEPLGYPFRVERYGGPTRGPVWRAGAAVLCAAHGIADGIELVRELSARGPAAKLWILTEDPTEETGSALLHAGSDLWLPLRLSPTLVRAFLIAATRRAGSWGREQVLLNSHDCTVSLLDWTAKFTHSQFRIVEYLLCQRERWVPEHELRERALDKRGSSDSLVRVYIRSIRRALGPHQGCLRSAPRLGYRLSLDEVMKASGVSGDA